MTRWLDSDQRRIFVAALLRALGIGMTGVMLGIYLSTLGWGSARIGVLIALGFAEAAVATLFVSFLADRAGRRRTLAVFIALHALGWIALAFVRAPGLLMVLGFLGMVNGLGRARDATYALEQVLLPETTTPELRTYLLAAYGVVLDGGAALGSLLAGLPYLLRRYWGWDLLPSYQVAWLLVAALSLACVPLYLGLSPRVEVQRAGEKGSPISPAPRRRVAKLAALMGLDALGGGFLTSAIVSYWFFRRFGVGEEWLGPLFLTARMLNALSQPLAAWISRRIGLINTMVFTHIPSSLFLFAAALAPGFGWATAFFLACESLVEMDVPTRQSYILAVVESHERSYASGLTTFSRNIARILGSGASGVAMSALGLASPLFLGGGLKITYDLLLYQSFRHLKPPEEITTARTASCQDAAKVK